MILELLRGFAFGLFLSCPAWFLIGMMEPRHALEEAPYTRTRVILRTWFVLPFIAVIAGLTSLWGDGASLAGWLLGLGGYGGWLLGHKRLQAFRANRRRRARERAEAEARDALRRRMEAEQAREAGAVLPKDKPRDADAVVAALWEARRGLRAQGLEEAARQADRVYGRYRHVLGILEARFEPGEVTHERYQGLLAQVCFTAADNFTAMEGLKAAVAAVDLNYVRRRLGTPGLGAAERQALEARQTMVEDTERRLAGLAGATEQAITALDHAAVTLGGVQTKRGKASVDARTALADLQVYLDQAEKFHVGPTPQPEEQPR